MIISCPRCGTRYRVDAAQLGAEGREVRCSHCRHGWFVVPEPDEGPKVSSSGAQAMPALAEMSLRMGRVGKEMRQQTRAILSWLMLAAVGLGIAGLVFGRNDIAAALPQTATLYKSVGLPLVIDAKLEFRQVSSEQIDDGEAKVLIVSGKILNGSPSRSLLPPIRLELLGDDNTVRDSRDYELDAASIDAGDLQDFEIRFADPPPETLSFRLGFPAAGSLERAQL